MGAWFWRVLDWLSGESPKTMKGELLAAVLILSALGLVVWASPGPTSGKLVPAGLLGGAIVLSLLLRWWHVYYRKGG